MWVRNSDYWSLITAGVLIVILSINGHDVKIAFSIPVAGQQANTDNLKLWLSNYHALELRENDWKETLKTLASQDLVVLFNTLNLDSIGLMSNADKLLIDKVERLSFNDTELEASLTYVYTEGSSGLLVTASTWQALFMGIEQLASRRDIQIQAITMVTNNAKTPTSIINLAIVLRDVETH
jgi:hypothetical protein